VGVYSALAPADLLAGLKGPTSKGREGEKRIGKGEGKREEKKGEGRGPRLALVWASRMVNPALVAAIRLPSRVFRTLTHKIATQN